MATEEDPHLNQITSSFDVSYIKQENQESIANVYQSDQPTPIAYGIKTEPCFTGDSTNAFLCNSGNHAGRKSVTNSMVNTRLAQVKVEVPNSPTESDGAVTRSRNPEEEPKFSVTNIKVCTLGYGKDNTLLDEPKGDRLQDENDVSGTTPQHCKQEAVDWAYPYPDQCQQTTAGGSVTEKEALKARKQRPLDGKLHRCELCDYTSIRKGNLVQHVKNKHNAELQIHRCGQCGYKSKWKEAYERHIKSKHDDKAEVYTCAHCPYTTKIMACLIVHVKGKHINAPDEFRCNECEFTTSWRSVLWKHVRRKHDVNAEIFSCPHCEHTTKTKHSMTQHIKVLHDENAEMYSCPHCEYSTRNKNGLAEHIRVKHDDSTNVYTCAQCDYTTKRRSHLLRHMNKHGLVVSAPTTRHAHPEDTPRRRITRRLRPPGEAANKKERKHVCEECGYTARQRVDVVRHAARKHADVRPHTCPHCSYAGRVRGDLAKHIAGKHGAQRYVCPDSHCSYITTWRQRFVQHVRARHGEHLLLVPGAETQDKGAMGAQVKPKGDLVSLIECESDTEGQVEGKIGTGPQVEDKKGAVVQVDDTGAQV